MHMGERYLVLDHVLYIRYCYLTLRNNIPFMHSYDSIACHAICCRTHTVGLLIFLTVETTLNNDEKIKVGDKFISILGICRCVSFTI